MTYEAENKGTAMFQYTARKAREGLEGLLDKTEKEITGLIESMVPRVQHDYRTAIIEAKIKKYSEDQVQLRRKMGPQILQIQQELQLMKYVDAETT